MVDRTRVSVIGVGHLGQIHARILAEHDLAELISVVDLQEERAREIGQEYNVDHYQNVERMLRSDGPDAAIVAVPTEAHFEVASTCLKEGVDLLVEKPLTQDIDDARTLVDQAGEAGIVLQVGHVERFNPAVAYLREHVQEPKFIECDRLSPFQFRSADIDVIQDVMIHDLDILRALVPGQIDSVEAVGTSVITPHADIANARLWFSSDCIANLSASRISMDSVRKLRVFTPDAYYSLDYSEKQLDVYRASDRVKQFDLSDIQKFQEQSSSGGPDTKELFEACLEIDQVVPASEQDKEPLKLELDEFLNAVRNQTAPKASGKDGLEALKLARQIRAECSE